MATTSIYPVIFNGKEWVAVMNDLQHGREKLMAAIKTLIRKGLPTEEEWAALAIIERRVIQDRWMSKGDPDLCLNLSRILD